MINFHTITLKAQELYNIDTGQPEPEVFCSPVQILFSKARHVEFCDGDRAEVLLTDGTRFIFLYENREWNCCKSRYQYHEENSPENTDLIKIYGPYLLLEEALNDLISRRNYLSAMN